jgi:hypothetical protein
LQPSAAAVSLPEPEGISDAPDWAKPNQQWVEKFVQDFQQLRSQVRQCYDDGGEGKGQQCRTATAVKRFQVYGACERDS